MTKDANQNDASIRIAIGARIGSTGITRITMILRKKNRRKRNTGATAAIAKATAGMITIGRGTSVVAPMDLALNIHIIRINGVMTKAPKMSNAMRRAGTKHLAMADV